MREPEKRASAFEPVPLAHFRSACHEAEDAMKEAELVRAFRRLDPADREHILKMSRRLVDWHN